MGLCVVICVCLTGTISFWIAEKQVDWSVERRIRVSRGLQVKRDAAREVTLVQRYVTEAGRRLDSSETADCDSMWDVAQNLKANNSWALGIAYFVFFWGCVFTLIFGSIWLGHKFKPLPPKYWKNRQGRCLRPWRYFRDNYEEEIDCPEMIDAMQRFLDATTESGKMGKGRDGAWARHKSFEVLKVKRIENGRLWTRYQQVKNHIVPYTKSYESTTEKMKETAVRAVSVIDAVSQEAKKYLENSFARKGFRLDDSRCETFLFHGSPGKGARNTAEGPSKGQVMFHSERESPVGVIKKQGFDDRLGSTSGMLGSGSYFADKASKADCYGGRYNSMDGPEGSYTSVDEVATMFLCRVAMGTPHLTQQSMEQLRRPPCLKGHFDFNLTFKPVTITSAGCKQWADKGVEFEICDHPRFDSVIADLTIDGGTKLYREFVVYDKQAHPEFCITYKRKAENADSSRGPPSASKSGVFGRKSSG